MLPTDWWRIFNDADLNVLEAQAIEANQDLKRAVARVTEARAIARVSAAELYPSISAGGAYSRNRLSENRGGIPQQKLESDDFLVALLASWLPARRAAKVDPMEALRYE